ncbi:MAG: methylated-DNA--[protein]-cysteine S-methyltransferase [Candidatus Brocadiaceae bacterium]
MQIKVQKNSLKTILFGSFCTPIGDVYVAKSILGICRISFPHVTAESFLLPFQRVTDLIVQRNDPALHDEISLLKEYFDGKQVNFDFPLDFRGGTPFQVKVWEKLREIPYGECRTYKWVAEQIGNPFAVRAVGMANNKNPLPPVVPCHRVIGSDGSLTGYASGIHIKKWLIEMEHNTKMKYV